MDSAKPVTSRQTENAVEWGQERIRQWDSFVRFRSLVTSINQVTHFPAFR